MTSATGPESNIEREVKLDAGLRFTLPDLGEALPGLRAVALPDAKLQATYVDTPDLRLMRWGITLRHRRDAVGGEGAEMGWTLKLPSDAGGIALVRRELTWPGKLGPVPPEAANLVRAVVRGESLGPVARLTTQRRRVRLQDADGRGLAEVDDDVVSVLDGRRLAARFREVEIELLPGAPSGLLEVLVQRVTAAGAIRGDDRPKVVRAIGARASLGPDVVVPEVGPDATMAEVVAAAIGSGVTRIIRHDAGVRLGDDAEHVHQARVGTRRLRSDLRTFSSVLDGAWVGEMRTELGFVAAALGEVRDADVLTEGLEADVAALPEVDARPGAALLHRLAVQRDEDRARLLDVLNSDRYLAVLNALSRAAADPPLREADPDERAPAPEADGGRVPPEPNGDQPAARFDPSVTVPSTAGPTGGQAPATGVAPTVLAPGAAEGPTQEPASHRPARPGDLLARQVLPQLCRGPWRHLRQAVEALGDDPEDAALHQVRIRSKRLRYATEAAEGVIGKPARKLASAAADLQGVLGDLNDAVVAEAWLRTNAERAPSSQALVAGELITTQRQRQGAGREHWAKAWKAVNHPGLRAWLK